MNTYINLLKFKLTFEIFLIRSAYIVSFKDIDCEKHKMEKKRTVVGE